MLKEKASAFGNVIVPEMLKALPMGFTHEVARWFHKRFQENAPHLKRGKCGAWHSSRKPNAKRDQRVQS